MPLFHRHRPLTLTKRDHKQEDEEMQAIYTSKSPRIKTKTSKYVVSTILLCLTSLFMFIFITSSIPILKLPTNQTIYPDTPKRRKRSGTPMTNSSTLFQYPTITITPFLDIQDTLPKDEAAIFESAMFINDINPTKEIDAYLIQNVKKRYSKVTFHDHGALTRRGYKNDGKYTIEQNQDRAIIVHPQSETSSNSKFAHLDFLIGIFDGHGTNGHLISDFVSKHLFDRIKTEYYSSLSQTKQGFVVEDVIERSFAEIQNQILSLKSETTKTLDVPSDAYSLAQTSGCTASIFIRLGDAIVSANIGDSSSLIAVYSKTEQKSHIIFSNRKDKPHLPSEKERIEAHGGVVVPPKMFHGELLSSRAFNIDKNIGLAMSRVFGDIDAQRIGVIAEPIVQVLSIKSILDKFHDEDIMFAIVMSDGTVQDVKEQEVVDELGKALSDQDSLDAKGMMEVLQDLIMKSSKSWLSTDMGYRDDITIAFQVIKD